MKNLFMFVIFLTASCSSFYYKVDLSKIRNMKDATNISLICGTYDFSSKFCFLRGRIGLNIQREGKNSPDTYFAFENESGDFLFVIDPGNYKIVSVGYFSESTYEIYDIQLVNYSFRALPSSILYLGNFTPSISFDVEYIYWGISDIRNNFESDKKYFIKKLEGFDNFEFQEVVPEKLGKIKKLKYSPATPYYTNI